jgi:hypothetical protein
MNKTETAPWSKRRLWWTIVFVFAAQISGLYLLGERHSMAALGQNEKLDFQFVTTEMSGKEIFDSMLAGDPTLFVLPGLKDFSGEAWLKNKSADYAPPIWDEPPNLLPLDVESLGKAFVAHVRSNQSAGIQIAEQVFPKSERTGPPIRIEKLSSFRLEGDLVKRELTVHPKIPAMSHTEPVAETVVQIAVNGAGEVVATRLLSPRNGEPGSLPLATEKALEISRSLRFRPVSRGTPALDWGKISFRWQTLPVLKTNVVNNFE